MIPRITDPLGKYWEQPDHPLIDETHALMSQADFDMLKNYEISLPSGTYAGKMWRHYNQLCWYYDIDIPGQIGIGRREIIIC